MLTKMLAESTDFKKRPMPEQQILIALASHFQQQTDYLFQDPDELVESIDVGTRDQWKELLLLNETQNFIKGQMAFLSQVNQRKTFRSLVEMALMGNQQAAKQVQELSGIMNQQDTNRTIVLHRIPRPEETNG